MEKTYLVGEDGFVFRPIDKSSALALFGLEEVFGIDDEGHEGAIETLEDFDRFRQFGLEVGFIEVLKDELREPLRHHASALLSYTNDKKHFYCDFDLGNNQHVDSIFQVNGEIGVLINNQEMGWEDLSEKEQERLVQFLEDEDCLGKTRHYLEED